MTTSPTITRGPKQGLFSQLLWNAMMRKQNQQEAAFLADAPNPFDQAEQIGRKQDTITAPAPTTYYTVASGSLGNYYDVDGANGETFVPVFTDQAVAQKFADDENLHNAGRRIPRLEVVPTTLREVEAALLMDPTYYAHCRGVWMVTDRNLYLGPYCNLVRFGRVAGTASASEVRAWGEVTA